MQLNVNVLSLRNLGLANLGVGALLLWRGDRFGWISIAVGAGALVADGYCRERDAYAEGLNDERTWMEMRERWEQDNREWLGKRAEREAAAVDLDRDVAPRGIVRDDGDRVAQRGELAERERGRASDPARAEDPTAVIAQEPVGHAAAIERGANGLPVITTRVGRVGTLG